jgi:replicative DNA helicase
LFDKTYNIEEILEKEDDSSFDDWLESEFSQPDKEIKEEILKENKEITTENLLVESGINIEELDEIQKEMFETIKNTDKIAWEREGGYSTGFKLLDEKLMGIQPGFALLGAYSNVGKSSFLLFIANQASKYGKLYSLYFSLDDGSKDLLPRIISSQENIPINAIRLPTKYQDHPIILQKRKEGIKNLYESLNRFKIIDQDKGTSIEFIEREIKRHYDYLKETNSERKLFVQIDNFHDIDSEDITFRDDKSRYGYFAEKLKRIAETYDIPIWCTAELRKANTGHTNKRPTKDEIREAGKIVYAATLCLMLYNEVGLEQENATIFYRSPDMPGKLPVLEISFDKNKQSDFKGNLFYEFIPNYALFVEATKEECEHYNNLIYQG